MIVTKEVIEVIHTNEGIWLSQRKYALEMLSKYCMADCKLIFVPLDQNLKLSASEGEILENPTMQRKTVGSLIYMSITRPDLNYTVDLESQFMQLPMNSHLDAMRCTLEYVRVTLNFALLYARDAQIDVYGYTNANWIGSVSDCRSTNNFMLSFGSVAITWSSKKKPTISLSIMEVE